MKTILNVHGSAEQARPLIIGKDTVYFHTNIVELDDGQYQYNEIQYGKDEYIQIMAEKTQAQETQMTDAQVALCEIYESMVI